MYYNLEAFGCELRNIRNSLGLTQKIISEKAKIHEDTLRKIENGKVLPTQQTLDLLSPFLKTDLNNLLLSFRLNNPACFKTINNEIESLLDCDNHPILAQKLDFLKQLVGKEENSYFINKMNQLALLLESILMSKDGEKINCSFDKLLEAMKITTPKFSLQNYQIFVLNPTEIRILMNIALLINDSSGTNQALEIMNYCLAKTDQNDTLYPKICHNLSYLYHVTDKHEFALKYSCLGIEGCVQQRNFNGLNLLFYRKGIASYLLNIDDFLSSLKKSINLCEMMNQVDLSNLLRLNCKKFYNIDLK